MDESPGPRRRKAAKAGSPEKRLRRKVSRPSQAIQTRIERAFTHRLYLLRRETPRTEAGALRCDFHVLGDTGNAYTVTLSRLPSCTCPDSLKGNVCKHRLFVLLRVLKVDQSNPLVWQNALIPSELDEVLGSLSQGQGQGPSSDDVLADAAAREAFARLAGSGSDAGSSGAKQRELEGDCPVCYEPFAACREDVTFCRVCGNNIHKDCFEHWKNSKGLGGVTCVWCRSPWEDAGTSAGLKADYINLTQYSQEHRSNPEPEREDMHEYWRKRRRGGRRDEWED